MIKQTLNQKMIHRLSPQQIQLMKLLQIPSISLDQRIKEELEANPALDENEEIQKEEKIEDQDNSQEDIDGSVSEKEESFELDDYILEYIEDDPISYRSKNDSELQSIQSTRTPFVEHRSFHDYLLEQLGMLNPPGNKKIIAEHIIGSIDDDGYLRRDSYSIEDDLIFSQNIYVSQEEIQEMIKVIQQFDPLGVGARDLQECLSIQLKRKQKTTDNKYYLELAINLIDNYFELFSKKHYQKLIKQLKIDKDTLRNTIDLILKLNPKPASGFITKGSNNLYIFPDFIIRNTNGDLELTLNSKNAPDLKINDQYVEMLSSYNSSKKKNDEKRQKEAVMFIKQKIDSAKWFIDAIKQRQQTMYKVMYAIMQYQYDYFLLGDRLELRPMVLKDIAAITDLDISTVSRVASNKYVQTEYGILSLKSFFSESVQNSAGEDISSYEIKKYLQDVVNTENKKKPLSDEKLKEALDDKGYNIARRTVAKYREQLGIPVARYRKEI